MDCPAEENLIRMKLEGLDEIAELRFDLVNRNLTVFHEGPANNIDSALRNLNLGSKKISTEYTELIPNADTSNQGKILSIVLAINLVFFLVEMITGLISESMGLVADSMDMLADAFVYGISLYAIGGTLLKKQKIARMAGNTQVSLAILGFGEVLRRFLFMEISPDFSTMIVISVLALVANAICLLLLQKADHSEEAHIRASMIFTSNDVIINIGVILSGALVYLLNSNKPDLIIGAIVFILVLRGGIRIIRLGKG